MIKRIVATALASTSLAMLLSGHAYAQSDYENERAQSRSAPSGLNEIVVTAQRREESLQDTSLSITALSGDSLQDRQIVSITGLAEAVPNVDLGVFGGSARFAIRGIGFDTINPGAEGRIAYHLDGIYIGRPAAQIGTFFDVERVEVLRGPQGTLYGRNATGGSINVISRKPEDYLGGYIRAGFGNYDALSLEGAVGGPLGEGVRARIAAKVGDRSGYGKNLTTGKDVDDSRSQSIRASLSFDVGSDARLDLIADYHRENDANYANHYLGDGNDFITPFGFVFGGTVPENSRDIDDPFDTINEREFWGVGGALEVGLGALTLKAITAYRDSEMYARSDLDVTSYPLAFIAFEEEAEQFSQEVQLSGEFDWGTFIAGAYYFDEKISGGSEVPISGIVFALPDVLLQGYAAYGDSHTKAAAAFGQVDLNITSSLTAIFGLRYSWERKSIDDYGQFDLSREYAVDNPPIPYVTRRDSTSDTAFTPKFGLEWRPVDDLMVYATVSKGFKSGGFNLGDNLPPFDPETIWAYEAGVKSTFANGRVRLNAAGFYYDYTNLQVSKVIANQVVIENAASSELYGFEADLTVNPIDGLTFDFSGALLHSEYNDFATPDPARPELVTPENPTGTVVLDGNQLTQAPKRSFTAGVEYEAYAGDVSIKPRVEVVYQSRMYFTPFNLERVSREPNTKLNAFLNLRQDALSVGFYVRNLTDRRTVGNALIASSLVGYPVVGTYDPPRTYGVQVGYEF